MDGSSKYFWSLVVALGSASAFFGVSAAQMSATRAAAAAEVKSGDLLTLDSVVDGDTVVLRLEAGDKVPVRLLGIKAFEAEGKDAISLYGRAAVDTLRRKLDGQPVRVLVHSTPKDKHGRTLATLYVDDDDVGLGLIRDGLALAYTVYPFPAMSLYVSEQARARGDRKGIWAEARAAERADAMAREWRHASR